MKSNRFLTLVLAASVVLCGCLDEKDTVTVFPDGSGMIHIHKKLGDGLSQMTLSGTTKDTAQAAMDKTLYKDLALWQGVNAWTGCKASLDGTLVVTDVVGYFSDVSQVKRVEGTTTQAFTWTKNGDGGFTLRWSNVDTNSKNQLDQPEPLPAQTQQMLDLMKGLKFVHEIDMPGPVTLATGVRAHEGRTATGELNDRNMADFFTMVNDYRARVAKGAITKDKANAEIDQKIRLMSLNMMATCGPVAAGEEFAQFKKAFEAAKADYLSAGTAQKIQDANKG